MRIIAATAAILALATAVLAELNPAFHAEAPTGKVEAGDHKDADDRFRKLLQEWEQRHHARVNEDRANEEKRDHLDEDVVLDDLPADDLEVKPL